MNITENFYCRLCAELKAQNELTNLQTDEETCQKVVNKLSRFNITMDFQENTLPKTVCLICVKSLERAFAFVTAVEQAQTFLSDFILGQTGTDKSATYGKITFYMPSNVGKEIIDVKVESRRDPMNVNDDSNLGEECHSETSYNVYSNDSVSEEVYIENKYATQTSLVIVDEKNNIKDESDVRKGESLYFGNDCTKNQNTNVRKDKLKIKETRKLSALRKKLKKDNKIKTKHKSESVPILDTDYLSDYINESKYNTVDAGIAQKLNEHTFGPTSPKLLDTTVYSEDYINKQINRLSTVPVQCLKMTWMNYEWKCSHCGTLFSNIEELQKHSMHYHSTCNAYQCTDCKIKKQRLNAFIKHVRSHRKYLHYSCYKCFEKFPKMMETIQHKLKVHENSKHICLGCNTTFSSDVNLQEHVNKYYNILWKQKTFINSDNLTCSTCNKVCTNITALRNHLNKHKEKKRDRVCDRCGKCFDSEPSLKTHMATHTEKMLYHCEICKTTFKTIYSLRYHASVHSGIKPFTCDVCSKCFRTRSQITNHMKFHTDYFPITCTVCNKKFRTDSYLQNHMLQHTGEKPFSCDICPRDFTNMANRNKHMRRRHGIEMAKRRQAIIKRQTGDESTSSDLGHLATGQAFADIDKMNEWKNKIMEHRKSQSTNNKVKKREIISKQCNEN